VIDQWDHRDLNELLATRTAELLVHRAWELLTGAGLDVPRSACGGRPTRGGTSTRATTRTAPPGD